MGVMIHVIAEIFKKGKWQQIEEYPQSIKNSGYREYAVLAGVRDSFNQKLFDPKGLPEDLDKPYAHWESIMDSCHKWYENNTTSRLVFNNPDGTKTYEDIFSHDTEIEISEDMYNMIYKENPNPSRYFWLSYRVDGTKGTKQYFVHDASVVGAKIQEVPYNVLYATFEDYLQGEEQEHWNEIAQDYGSFNVNFDDECYFDHSYLTLEELLNADYTKYNSICYKLDREFYNMFIEHGGILPECFTISESGIGGLIDAMHEAVEPTITISWPRKPEDIAEMDMTKGIAEMREIAKKYGVANNEIRIVFAFS
jgi:hypothetical protein